MDTTLTPCALSAFEANSRELAGKSPVDVIPADMAVAVGILRAMLDAELVPA